MQRKKIRKLAAGLLSGVLILSACGSNPPAIEGEGAQADTEKSVYRLMYYNEINSLNYLVTGTQVDYALAANLVDNLVDYDSYGNIIPGLAESWSANEDMSVWTFNIRPGIQWVDCDGKEVAEVVAEDWVTSARYVNDAVNESYSQYTYSTGSLVHNAQNYYDYTDYMIKSAGGTKTTDDEGNELTPVAEVKPEDIGVSAPDKYTLVYTLDQPCPFFLSALSYTSFMPVNREFLEKTGDMFGRSKENILYNGAYRLSEYIPQERRILVKNDKYWDKDKVLIDEIDQKFRADVLDVGPDMFLNGEVDRAVVSMDIMEQWMADPEKAAQVHSMRPDISYSYFYCFNFDPEFDAAYEPENWAKAVTNENFRKSLMYALDRKSLAAVHEPYNPEILLQRTITPETFVSAGGKDYVYYPPFDNIERREGADPASAASCRDAARAELEAKGVTFPVKVLMPYNPTSVNWDKECDVAKKQIEDALGTDYVEVIIERGPDTGFLGAVRRSGKYAFMLCNFGADYADPETYTEPFTAGNKYNFWDGCEDADVKAIFTEYEKLTEEAKTTYDAEARYEKFAEAEALLIEHAIAVPARVSNGEGYVADRLSQFDGEFAPYGLARERYKGMYLHEKSMGMEEFNAVYEEWEAERLNNL